MSPGLNTPMKKIRNLSIRSPGSPQNLPPLDFAPSYPLQYPVLDNMATRGYSQTLSTKVLRELDSRAAEIRRNFPTSTTKSATNTPNPFSQLESISLHYAAGRAQTNTSPGYGSSATKKRRTLNGPEEIFGPDKENESPVRRKMPELGPTLSSLRSSPVKEVPLAPLALPSLRHSPASFSRPSLSPLKISPSKGHMNLNGLLRGEDGDASAPKSRATSLESAGVLPAKFAVPRSRASRHPSFQPSAPLAVPPLLKKPSIPTLSKKPSVPSLQKKPLAPHLGEKPQMKKHMSLSQLQNTLCIPQLHTKPSMPQLQKKPSIPQLQKKPSIPRLQKKSSIPQLQKKPSIPQLHSRPPSAETHPRPSISQLHKNLPLAPALAGRSHVTVPQPFSLYNKPTILLLQKSLALAASDRLLGRFQKFKDRFS